VDKLPMLNVAGSTPAARSRKTGIGEDEKGTRDA
jgi:hypothetical protein